MVECNLAKVDVEGSNPFSRSVLEPNLALKFFVSPNASPTGGSSAFLSTSRSAPTAMGRIAAGRRFHGNLIYDVAERVPLRVRVVVHHAAARVVGDALDVELDGAAPPGRGHEGMAAGVVRLPGQVGLGKGVP